MAYIGVACIVMAYVGMPYASMAYVPMAYVHMVYIVMAYMGIAYTIVAYNAQVCLYMPLEPGLNANIYLKVEGPPYERCTVSTRPTCWWLLCR